MDGVVDVKFAIEMGKQGGLGVLNLDGIHSRYENVDEVYEKIAAAPPESSTELVQKLYKEPVKDNLIAKRIKEIKKGGVPAAVSCIPMNAERFGPIAQEAGADLFFVQSTVATVRHIASKYKVVDLGKLIKSLKIPVIMCNTGSSPATLELMETGCVAVLVGVGPGAACPSRVVLGIGAPQV